MVQKPGFPRDPGAHKHQKWRLRLGPGWEVLAGGLPHQSCCLGHSDRAAEAGCGAVPVCWFTSLLKVLLSCIIGFRLAQCQGELPGTVSGGLPAHKWAGTLSSRKNHFQKAARVLGNLLHLSLSRSVTLERSQLFSTPQYLCL